MYVCVCMVVVVVTVVVLVVVVVIAVAAAVLPSATAALHPSTTVFGSGVAATMAAAMVAARVVV